MHLSHVVEDDKSIDPLFGLLVHKIDGFEVIVKTEDSKSTIDFKILNYNFLYLSTYIFVSVLPC